MFRKSAADHGEDTDVETEAGVAFFFISYIIISSIMLLNVSILHRSCSTMLYHEHLHQYSI